MGRTRRCRRCLSEALVHRFFSVACGLSQECNILLPCSLCEEYGAAYKLMYSYEQAHDCCDDELIKSTI